MEADLDTRGSSSDIKEKKRLAVKARKKTKVFQSIVSGWMIWGPRTWVARLTDNPPLLPFLNSSVRWSFMIKYLPRKNWSVEFLYFPVLKS